jgi:hypothetical protein
MKQQSYICKKIKCSHLNQEEHKCVFDDCIFTTSEIIIKEESIDNKEICLFLIKFAGSMAFVFLLSLVLLKVGDYI